MRRTDREVTDPGRIHEMIHAAHCCRLGFCDQGSVYIVPLSFGYEKRDGKYIFYFHSAREGRKIGLIGRGTKVGFELDTGYRLNTAAQACRFSAAFQSIIGTGTVSPVEDLPGKRHALQRIMEHYSGETSWDFSPDMVDRIAVFMLEAEELSCKEHL